MLAPSNARIVVVDDEPMVASALRSFLELETSYEVQTFTDPRAALESIAAEHAHVVVADFMIPEVDGITFLKQVREVRPLTTRIQIGRASCRDRVEQASL